MPSKHALRFLVAAIGLAAATLVAAPHPVSTTTGDLVAPPYLSTNQFGVSGMLESVAVPLSGWKVVWAVKDDKDPNPVSGIRVIETNDVVRGARLPVLRLELTRGAYRYWQPVIELAQPFNAETHNILSFIAKVEVPPTLKRVLKEQQTPRAKDLLERAAPILGYHAASDKPAADGRQPSAGLLACVKRLDDKMALCGARRPPAAP